MILTIFVAKAILLPSVSTPAGICNPLSIGVKTPSYGVFYCPKKIVAPLVRAFVMVARSGQPKGWPAPIPGIANLLRVAAQMICNVWRRLFILSIGVTAMNTQATGEIRPNSAQNTEAVDDFFQQILDLDAERQTVTETGIPALIRLAAIAERDTGQANTVRSFLLGLYNGHCFPFNLTRLRGLDKSLFDDCMAVLTLDARATAKEVHHYFDNGGERFERWAQGGAE
jgi:hypothetical protein